MTATKLRVLIALLLAALAVALQIVTVALPDGDVKTATQVIGSVMVAAAAVGLLWAHARKARQRAWLSGYAACQRSYRRAGIDLPADADGAS